MMLIVATTTHVSVAALLGGTDNYIIMSHGDGLHASPLEPEITAHAAV
jgi:hypothetical protein